MSDISCNLTITDKERQILSRALELVPDGVAWLTAEEFEALRRKLEMAAAVTLPPAPPAGPPIVCPYCGGRALFHDVAEWRSRSLSDDCDLITVVEFQCAGSCGGRSFWADPPTKLEGKKS